MKQELINEIMSYPVKYALLMGFFGENKAWDKDKLTYLEFERLKDIKRDLETFERNNKELHG